MTGSSNQRRAGWLTMESSLPSRYGFVNLIVFIYELDVRYGRHAKRTVRVAKIIRK